MVGTDAAQAAVFVALRLASDWPWPHRRTRPGSHRLRLQPSGVLPSRSRDTSSMTAREAAGVGFVITPFNRRWHAAACPHVRTMTVGTRKWFAATPAELAEYLQARITQYETAKPIDACPACVPE